MSMMLKFFLIDFVIYFFVCFGSLVISFLDFSVLLETNDINVIIIISQRFNIYFNLNIIGCFLYHNTGTNRPLMILFFCIFFLKIF